MRYPMEASETGRLRSWSILVTQRQSGYLRCHIPRPRCKLATAWAGTQIRLEINQRRLLPSGAGLALRKRAELLELLRPCFARTGPWLQAGKYAAAVMSELSERNGWSIARHAGDRTPDKTRRLLNYASRDTFAAMSVVRRSAVAGQEKAGEATAGVKRQNTSSNG